MAKKKVTKKKKDNSDATALLVIFGIITLILIVAVLIQNPSVEIEGQAVKGNQREIEKPDYTLLYLLSGVVILGATVLIVKKVKEGKEKLKKHNRELDETFKSDQEKEERKELIRVALKTRSQKKREREILERTSISRFEEKENQHYYEEDEEEELPDKPSKLYQFLIFMWKMPIQGKIFILLSLTLIVLGILSAFGKL